MPEVNTPDANPHIGPAEVNGHLVPMLTGAIRRALCVDFNYDGKPRVVEVHAVGRSVKDGSLVMRGFQVAGAASRPLPQWTLFSVEKMVRANMVSRVSQAPREGYVMGDSQMSTIIAELKL